MKYQCDKIGEFITPQYGWIYCPYCGVKLKTRKYMIPETHEVFNIEPPDKPDRIEVTSSIFN